MNSCAKRTIFRLGLLIPVAIWLTGCASPTQPSRFYRLESLSPPTPMPQAAEVDRPLPRVGIGPVQLASYLDRPQIVERSTPYRLTLNEFDRWAGTLQENMVQLLQDVVQRKLPGAQIIGYPWHSGVRPDYEVRVTIDRFERQGMKMRLEAGWALIEQPAGRPVRLGRHSFDTPIEDSGMEGIVAAASAVLVQLADTLANELEPRLAVSR